MRAFLSGVLLLVAGLLAIPAVQGLQNTEQASAQDLQQLSRQKAAEEPDRLQAERQVNPHASPYVQTGTENAKGDHVSGGTYFHTSERCMACHNGMKTSGGEDVSIGLQWQASIMANSSRDPYWQGSLRRETIDHPESTQFIEDDCSTCHMPAKRMPDRDRSRNTDIFSTFPLDKFPEGDKAAADGVTCSVCHQIDPKELGTEPSFSGDVKFSRPVTQYLRAEYGPYEVTQGHKTLMHSSTATYVPTQAAHVREAALCGSCHTLYTTPLGPEGEHIGRLPEQMPFLEWQHSEYNGTEKTCQSCHMPEVKQPVAITALYGQQRQGMHRHVFVGGNFLMQSMLQEHRDELATAAQPTELVAAIARTKDFLRTQAAKIAITGMNRAGGEMTVDIHVENLGGHKLPTAYPSRRVWLHVMVKDAHGHVLFESGHLNTDGSIVGNDNDMDPLKYEPHYRKITNQNQVEIYEDVLRDSQGRVTTGLLNAVGYLKDNRLLPQGFDKTTAVQDVAVIGDAANDPNFDDRGSTVRYVVETGKLEVPLQVTAELWYQPVGFRWAHNLTPYKASESSRMVRYFEDMADQSALLLTSAHGSR